jgi:hypothetical protein
VSHGPGVASSRRKHGPEPGRMSCPLVSRRFLPCPHVLNLTRVRVLQCPPVPSWFRERVTQRWCAHRSNSMADLGCLNLRTKAGAEILATHVQSGPIRVQAAS